eukprot:921455-Rhodomonas_salina.1
MLREGRRWIGPGAWLPRASSPESNTRYVSSRQRTDKGLVARRDATSSSFSKQSLCEMPLVFSSCRAHRQHRSSSSEIRLQITPIVEFGGIKQAGE